MGFRIQKSIRLGKFLRLNISKSGIGISAGIPGLRIGTGPRGAYFSAGLPGTGLSYRQKISNSRKADNPDFSSQKQSSGGRAARNAEPRLFCTATRERVS